jgi:hypothetical protein
MNVKIDFLNGVIQEEVYVRQPPDFENPKYVNRVYELSKALYGLKRGPRTWYAKIKIFLLDHRYVTGNVDKTLFTFKCGNDFLLLQIYVNDIIFGGSSHVPVSSFQEIIENEFQMSDRRTNLFLRYPCQENEACHFRTSSQVHEGLDEEI